MDLNKNYYKILDLSHKDDKKTTKKKYRDLSKKYHPDKNDGDDTTFKLILEAYKVLFNDDKKTKYDNESKFGKTYDETIELLNFEFSNENVSTDKYEKKYNNFKSNELIDIYVKLETFTSEITYTKTVKCSDCGGYGGDYTIRSYVSDCGRCDGTSVSCAACHGTNKVTRTLIYDCDVCDGTGEMDNDVYDNRCFACHGKGEVALNKCKKCNGDKIMHVKVNYKLTKDDFENGLHKKLHMGNQSNINIGKVGNLYIKVDDMHNNDL